MNCYCFRELFRREEVLMQSLPPLESATAEIVNVNPENPKQTKSGRLTLVGADLFDVSYFRHTGRWWTIDTDCSLKAALKYFREPSPVWPW
jgi:hypothetical protein